MAGGRASGYSEAMLDRFYLPLLALAAIAAVALALVWPQGLGDRSPGPFGQTPVQRTPEMQAAMKRETDAAVRRVDQAREAVRNIQQQAIAPDQ
ncbi:hypothetical protein [Phenylobacterium sp.]|uniref:hypothetical protein n=1 Tax=Phenylobacterium sp. TaxID=1871053 RepID=UPI00344E7202